MMRWSPPSSSDQFSLTWRTTDGMQFDLSGPLDESNVSPAIGLKILCGYMVSCLPVDELVDVYHNLADRCSVYGVHMPSPTAPPDEERKRLRPGQPRMLKPLRAH